MKKYIYMLCALTLVLLVSCNVHQPPSRASDSLKLTLELKDRKVHSIDDLHIEVVLTNQGDEGILLHRGLVCLPFPGPAWITAMYIMVSDSSGNLIFNETYTPKHGLPSEDTLAVLKPGGQIKKNLYFNSLGFYTDMFKKGRRYTIVAVYQNEIDVTKSFTEGPVSSWVGSIRSNEETFIVLP